MKIYDFITYRQVQTQCDWDLFLGRRIRRLSEFKFINHQSIFLVLLPIYMYISWIPFLVTFPKVTPYQKVVKYRTVGLQARAQIVGGQTKNNNDLLKEEHFEGKGICMDTSFNVLTLKICVKYWSNWNKHVIKSWKVYFKGRHWRCLKLLLQRVQRTILYFILNILFVQLGWKASIMIFQANYHTHTHTSCSCHSCCSN